MTLSRRTTGSDIDAVTASQLVDKKEAMLLDVREADEWEAGHAPGAVHMPLGGLVASEVTRHNLVIAVCRSGGRSAKATAVLRTRESRCETSAVACRPGRKLGCPCVETMAP